LLPLCRLPFFIAWLSFFIAWLHPGERIMMDPGKLWGELKGTLQENYDSRYLVGSRLEMKAHY
jgi:hypothetical protein